MKILLLLCTQLKHRHSPVNPSPTGFSILELLATIVIAGSAISALLYVMVQGMTYNQQEQGLNQINNDMQQSLDYITEDLRGAVYVYNGEDLQSRQNGTVAGLQTFLPSFGDNVQPILAFWKVESYTNDQINTLPTDCRAGFSNVDKQDECQALKIERRAYTLVVYLQSTVNSSNLYSSNLWKGESRIERYQLSKYSNLSNLTWNSGYVDPVDQSSFKRWPVSASGSNLQEGTPPSTRETLVDFVAKPTAVSTTIPDASDCEHKNKDQSQNYDYIRSPYDPSSSQSFFACVRKANNDDGLTFNQDVVLYLIPSKTGNNALQNTKANAFTFLKAQVVSRGVLSRTVPD